MRVTEGPIDLPNTTTLEVWVIELGAHHHLWVAKDDTTSTEQKSEQGQK